MAGAGSSGMVRVSVNLGTASVSAAQELLDALRFLIPGTRLEPGCIGCCAWVDQDHTVRYLEEWKTEADLRGRVRSDAFTSLLTVLESAREPRVQFDFVSSTRGLDYVAEVRNSSPR